MIDPGHQLGNSQLPARDHTGWCRPAGFKKPCNTTGTSTNGGYPEATFTWQVALAAAGPAREPRRPGDPDPRHATAATEWGPCVDRPRPGRQPGRRRPEAQHPRRRRPRRRSRLPRHRAAQPPAVDRRHLQALAAVREGGPHRLRSPGLPVATYIAGGDGLDIRPDLGTLNLSDVPTVMVELGNMRNRRDARRMTLAPRPGRLRPRRSPPRRTASSADVLRWSSSARQRASSRPRNARIQPSRRAIQR